MSLSDVMLMPMPRHDIITPREFFAISANSCRSPIRYAFMMPAAITRWRACRRFFAVLPLLAASRAFTIRCLLSRHAFDFRLDTSFAQR